MNQQEGRVRHKTSHHLGTVLLCASKIRARLQQLDHLTTSYFLIDFYFTAIIETINTLETNLS